MNPNYQVRFLPLGGVIGVTKNMYVYELYRDGALQDILIVDCGIGFPQDKALGVDFVIPDVSYLLDKTDKIRAILLTHGHEDHITALPFHYASLGKPPMFTAKLTAHFIENKFKESEETVQPTIIEHGKEYTFGGFRVEFLNMTHSIPDTTHIIIRTPIGVLYHGSDYKLDLTPVFGEPPDFYRISKAGHDGVLCLLSDCLGSERPGLTLSENIVGQTFEDEVRKTKGKFIMSTFSSNISRIRQCVDAAVKFNRKVCFLGRSMKQNTTTATEIGYLPIPKGFTISDKEIMKLPANKVCIIAAGSQGQYNSALSRIASNTHQSVKIAPGDKVLFSSDPIPGNENAVYEVVEDLVVMGAQVVYSDVAEELHASGHGNQEDIKFLMSMTKPKYHIPIGGTIRHQRGYQRLAMELGHKKESVFMLNEGETVVFERGGPRLGAKIETRSIYVDAQGVGDVGQIVLRDRKTLSTEGIVVAVLILDQNAQLVGPARLISRGFVFEKKEEEMFDRAQGVIENILKTHQNQPFHFETIRRDVSKSLESFFYKKKGREPLVIVDIIQA